MRFSFFIIAACALLFGAGRECQAADQLRDLEAAFTANPQVKYVPTGSEQYYDIVVENLCDGPVSRLAHDWAYGVYGVTGVSGQILSRSNNRLVLINARLEFVDGSRNPLDLIIFSDGNFDGAHSQCIGTLVRGVPSAERVKVSLELIHASELTPTSIAVIGAGLAALTALVNPYAGIVVGVAAASTKAYGASKDVARKAIAAGGSKFLARPVLIGSRYPKNIQATAPRLAEVHFAGSQQEWLYLHRLSRPQLLAYAGPYPKSITDEIDHVTVNATWDEMVEGANRDANPYMTPGQLTLANNVFCASLRRRLDSALQRDVLAVEIGLYGYLLGHGAQFSGDPNRANRGCLERTEFSDLVKQGYIIGY